MALWGSLRQSTWAVSSLILLNLWAVCNADPRITQAGLFCGQNRTRDTTAFFPLFTRDMEIISTQLTNNNSDTNNWGHNGIINGTNGKGNMSFFALAQCYGDLIHTDCLLCFAASRTKLPSCLPSLSARIYLDGCFLRYDDYNFFNESIDPNQDRLNCSSSVGVTASDDEARSLNQSVKMLVGNLSSAAVMNGGYFAAKEMNGLYGLAQCWNSLSREGCKACLDEASKNVQSCAPSREGRALNTGCYLRYSTRKFYNDGSPTTTSGASRTGKTVAIASSVAVFVMLVAFAAYAFRSRLKKKEQERKNLGRISSLYNKSNLNYKYETLEKATNYFDPKTKLGQGGAGSVYKGTLPDGKVVAVKRLFFSTRQWVDEFFNEVNLISGIEHKNLVKLLGCSIEGPESLLVYEFVPNKSLEQYLFDKDKIKILSWKERYQIIVGTAEGIAFLHGGTQSRIIHRDIKSSNVLLDQNLSPKIADFGLARHFADDKTHLSTGIAGTLGYMAPEYLVKGQLTEKADAYSYGVLVLEIVCGRKNNAFVQDSGSLLQSVSLIIEIC
ncbi:OLC1v1011724C1 [Oldenlandia corymbosa var. corymbosa]|uniref:OLC1v1011724C1 n=1 Tax=Oldenlandia corymbosa var. corymbosa TaxID=529605 RepID=A0AAV1DXI1_OLDCO|nr:OLC1v1011724C1 [Oldenlandia corymbosa var. corymbosa]